MNGMEWNRATQVTAGFRLKKKVWESLCLRIAGDRGYVGWIRDGHNPFAIRFSGGALTRARGRPRGQRPQAQANHRVPGPICPGAKHSEKAKGTRGLLKTEIHQTKK